MSVIRQKEESQNGCFKKAKHAKIFEKQIFTSWYAHVRLITDEFQPGVANEIATFQKMIYVSNMHMWYLLKIKSKDHNFEQIS